jgi:hypothetical protein
MTRSIFDPTGDETERGRSQFLGPNPIQNSKMPPAAVDRKEEGRNDDDVVIDDTAKTNPDRDDVT